MVTDLSESRANGNMMQSFQSQIDHGQSGSSGMLHCMRAWAIFVGFTRVLRCSEKEIACLFSSQESKKKTLL